MRLSVGGKTMAAIKQCLASVVAVVPILAVLAVPAVAADTPLFDAFQKYCISTNAQIDAVAAAVNRDHGVPGKITADVKPGTRMLKWDIPGLDYALTITVGNGEPGPSTPLLKSHSAVCSVFGKTDATGSLAAVRKWVGLPPEKQTNGKDVDQVRYAFAQQGNKRTALPLPPNPAFDDTAKSGGAWLLVAMGNTHEGFFLLSHNFEPPSALN